MLFSIKKKLHTFATILILLLTFGFSFGCKKQIVPLDENLVYVLNEPFLELETGESFQLEIINLRETDVVEWRSLQSGIANVDNQGVITALNPGETKVIAVIGDKILSCIVKTKISLTAIPTLEFQGMQKRNGEYKLCLIKGDEYKLTPVLEKDGREIEIQFTMSTSDNALSINDYTIIANETTQRAQVVVSCNYNNEVYSVICYVDVEEVS